MIKLAAAAAGLGAAAILGACAPDAIKPSPGYDGFLTQMQNACYYQRIGVVNVGDLLNAAGNRESIYFMDETSRLYFGKITSESWTSAVTAFLDGRASDPGIQCVLEQLEKARRADPRGVPRPPGG